MFSQEILKKDLFIYTNQGYIINENNENYFEYEMIGRFLSLSIIKNATIPLYLSLSIWRSLLKREPIIEDLLDFSIDIYQSILWIKSNDPTELLINFTIINNNNQIIPLCLNGEEIYINELNKNEYIKLYLNYYFNIRIQNQINSLIKGFYYFFDLNFIYDKFSPIEIRKILNGNSKINFEELYEFCSFSNPYNKEHPNIIRFFKIIKNWSQENLSKLLLFVTSSPFVPVGGFENMFKNKKPFKILFRDRSKYLQSYTCFNELYLPIYESDEEMEYYLLQSLYFCNNF